MRSARMCCTFIASFRAATRVRRCLLFSLLFASCLGVSSYNEPAPIDLLDVFNLTAEVPSTAPSISQNPTVTGYPSSLPSNLPSTVPSYRPSVLPSSSPTIECHDHASYRSPINGLSCADHRGTDCTSWRFVFEGNLTALGELIELCPESCNIPCGSFMEQKITLSIIISDIPNLLDVTTETPLLEVSLDYLESYVRAKGDNTFVMQTVELKSQEPLGRSLRRSRMLQDQSPFQLRVALSLIGFSLDFDSDTLIAFLIDGVNSEGYTSALQASSDFFSNAVASSTVRVIPTAVEQQPTGTSSPHDPMTATVLIAVIVGLVVTALAIGGFILCDRSRSRKRATTASQASSHAGLGTPNGESSFSQSSTPRGQAFYHSDGGNILGSLSRSSDENEFESDEQEKGGDFDSATRFKVNALPRTPIFSFDNINERKSPSKERILSEKFAVSTKRAQSAIMAALSPTRTGNQKATGAADISRSMPKNRMPKKESQLNDDIFRASADSFESERDYNGCDESSVSSTPAGGTEIKLIPVIKRSASGSDVDGLQNRSLGEILLSTLPNLGNSKFSRSSSKAPTGSPSRQRRRLDRAPSSPLKISVGGQRARNEFQVLPNPRRSRSASPRPLSHTPDLHPISQSMDMGGSSPTVRPSNVKRRKHHRGHSTGSLERKMQTSSLSTSISANVRPSQVQARSRGRDNSGGRNDASLSPTQLRYVFDAPAQGRLGLTLESSKSRPGCRIYAVKDYSPVYGLVNSRDRIVAIDNVDTTLMNSQQVSKILKARQHIKKGTIRLTVARMVENFSIPSLPKNDPSRSRTSHTIGSGDAIPSQQTMVMQTRGEIHNEDIPFLLGKLSGDESIDS